MDEKKIMDHNRATNRGQNDATNKEEKAKTWGILRQIKKKKPRPGECRAISRRRPRQPWRSERRSLDSSPSNRGTDLRAQIIQSANQSTKKGIAYALTVTSEDLHHRSSFP